MTTTSIDARAVTLPPTGGSSTNTAVAAMAGLLVLLGGVQRVERAEELLGGAMLAVRRRSVS